MSSSAAGPPNSSNYVEFDEYVDLKLQKTRSTIKTTDLLVALAGVAAMFLGYLLVFVVLDQWVIPGGFGIALRWMLLMTLLLLTAAWLGWKVGLPYLRSVNRLFAAQEIEKADPDLKSSLLNLVDLRDSGRPVNATILRTLEKRAAVGLQKIDVTQAIDNRPLMRTAYVLLGVVVLFSLYALFSPKKISNSIWRSLLPAADVGVATRTEILNVHPGDLTVLSGTKLDDVYADIAGEVPDKVALYFSTIDGAYQNVKVELRTDEPGQTRFKGFLLGESGKGILQDMTYVVRAGDAESREYRIRVKQPPQASGHRVRIEYPAYMKLEPVEQVGGQIDSWEGTKVTVSARTNMAVKRATIEWMDDAASQKKSKEETPVSVSSDGLQLTSTWTLAFNSNGIYDKAYQIQCWTESGETDPKPIAYGVTIRPDQPPEVAFLEPVRDIEAPANSTLPLLIEARDPDFELSHVYLHIKKNGQVVDRVILSEGRQQRVMIKHDLKLDQKMALAPGDLVELSVEAFDNRQPRPNRKSTPELKVKIVEPVSKKEAEQKLAEDKANRDQKQKEAEQEQNPEQRPDQPGQNGSDEKFGENGKQGDQPKDPMPKKQDPNNQKQGDDEGQGGDPGQSKSSGKNKDQGGNQGNPSDSSKGGKSKPQQGGDQGGDSKQQLNSEGDDDKEALERLMQKLNDKDKNSKKQSGNGGTAQNDQKQDSPSKEPKGSNGGNDQQSTPPESEKSSDKKQEDAKPSSKEKQDDKNARGSNQGQKPSDGSQQPMPKQDGADDSSQPDKSAQPGDENAADKKDPKAQGSDSPAKTSEKPEANSKGGSKKDEPKNEDASGDRSKPEKSASGSEPEKNADPKWKPEQGGNEQRPDGNPEQKADKPQPGNTGDQQNDEKAGKEGEKKNTDAAANGESGGKPENKPSMKKEGEGKPSDNPSANGPREQTKDSPDAKPEAATGNETGRATPDHDPKSKSTPSKNPGLERDPQEKPATRPGQAKSNDPSDTKDPGTAKPKPQPPGNKGQEKIDQQANDAQNSVKSKETEKRDGDPTAANEPKKGEGVKEQRSTGTAGGESGSGKQDSEGNPGSKESGKGDETQRPGDQQTADKKTGQPGGKKQPGSGDKTKDGNGEKKEGGEGNDESAGQPMPKEGESGEKKPSGNSDETSDQKQEASGQNKQTDKPSSKKDPSGPEKSQQGKQGGEKQNGDKKPEGGEQGKPSGEGGKPSSEQGSEGGEKGESGEGEGQAKPGGKPSGKQGKANSPPGGKTSGQPGQGGQGNNQGEGPMGNNEDGGTNEAVADDGDEANLEFKKQATELVLKRLKDQLERGDVDPELLQQLGWTEAEMRRFTERMGKSLQETKSEDATPESLARRQQFEEMLKSLNLKKGAATRTGDKTTQREVKQVESRRTTAPPEYRSALEKFTKELNRQKPAPKPSK